MAHALCDRDVLWIEEINFLPHGFVHKSTSDALPDIGTLEESQVCIQKAIHEPNNVPTLYKSFGGLWNVFALWTESLLKLLFSSSLDPHEQSRETAFKTCVKISFFTIYFSFWSDTYQIFDTCSTSRTEPVNWHLWSQYLALDIQYKIKMWNMRGPWPNHFSFRLRIFPSIYRSEI